MRYAPIHQSVLFLGDKPSKKNYSITTPFVGTKSYKTLLNWIALMNVDITMCSMANAYTVNGDEEDITSDVIFAEKIIALGDNAARRLDELNCNNYEGRIKYFKLPHPSGLNRKLNNKKELKKQLELCRNFIYG